jgi:predicted transcriptional regulator
MTEVRDQVREHVRSNPGVHFNELKRELDIATGQAQYHLRRLGRAGTLVSDEIGGRTHYFEDGAYDAWERRALALCRRETVREIVFALLDDGHLSAETLASDLGIARSTVSWHVSTLEDAGLVEKDYGERGRVELTLARPEETEALLRDVSPSLPDRLVDRFTKLVDAGLYGDD